MDQLTGRLHVVLTAAVTALVTIALVAFHVSVARSVWSEIALAAWCAVLLAHAWRLAGGRRDRLVAAGAIAPVLLAFGLLRLDASGIDRALAEARHSGDCAQALNALDRIWLGHRVAHVTATARGDQTVRACQRLQAAKDHLAIALSGETNALQLGFDALATVLADLPGHEKMVEVTLDGFLGALPTGNPCRTVEITAWLRERQAHAAGPSNNVLDRSTDVVTRTAPPALVGCGDELMAAKAWEEARARYRQLLDQYPGHELAPKARDGVKQATLAFELANVRSLLRGRPPAYCSTPAQYSGAAPHGTATGTNRALFYGNDEYTDRLPAEWRTDDPAEAVLVICAGDEEFGTPVRTCPYENKMFPRFPTNVTFRKIMIPLKVYELRTAKLVAETSVEIGGASCPQRLSYTYYVTDLGPPSEVYVEASDADVHAAFRSLIIP